MLIWDACFFPRGRVAMLATMGYIVPEYFRFPGATGFPIYAGTPKSSIYIIGLYSIVHPYWGSPMCIYLWKPAIVNYLFFGWNCWCLPKQDTALPRRGWNLLTSPMDSRPSARCVRHQHFCVVLFALQTTEEELSIELPVALEIGSFKWQTCRKCHHCDFSYLPLP